MLHSLFLNHYIRATVSAEFSHFGGLGFLLAGKFNHIEWAEAQDASHISRSENRLFSRISYSTQEYFRRIGFHTLLVLILGYGLILVLGVLEALSLLFGSLLYPFQIFCRICHHTIPPEGWVALVAYSSMKNSVVLVLAGVFHNSSSRWTAHSAWSEREEQPLWLTSAHGNTGDPNSRFSVACLILSLTPCLRQYGPRSSIQTSSDFTGVPHVTQYQTIVFSGFFASKYFSILVILPNLRWVMPIRKP